MGERIHDEGKKPNHSHSNPTPQFTPSPAFDAFAQTTPIEQQTQDLQTQSARSDRVHPSFYLASKD